MLQNKIYKNFIIEILKSFFIILLALSLIALTVRAVNFLELIVESGYSVATYFLYSFLNLFGLLPKFIPLSFLLSLIIFIIKHLQDSEFIILYTSGVKKTVIVKILFLVSIFILLFYLILSVFLTPYALNKSRLILGSQNFSSFISTIRIQKFTDSFKGFTFFVEEKKGSEIKNIFLQDKGNNFKNLSSNQSEIQSTTIISEKGLVEEKKLFLFNGKIINLKKGSESEIVIFDQLLIDLSSLDTTTIKQTKIQETSTTKLINCLFFNNQDTLFCNEDSKKEMLPTLNRRIVTPLYIPLISLICCLLLIKKNKNNVNNIIVYSLNFIVLLFTEIAVKYTGINYALMISFIILPVILYLIFYLLLIYNFSKEYKTS